MDIDPRLTDIKDCLYRVAVKAIIIHDNKMLLVKDNRDIGWSLPGGGVDYGEDLNTTLVRELAEEIGVKPEQIQTDFKVVATTIGHSKNGIPRCNLHFVVTVPADTIHKTGEIIAMDWISLDELDTITFDSAAGGTHAVLTTILSHAN